MHSPVNDCGLLIVVDKRTRERLYLLPRKKYPTGKDPKVGDVLYVCAQRTCAQRTQRVVDQLLEVRQSIIFDLYGKYRVEQVVRGNPNRIFTSCERGTPACELSDTFSGFCILLGNREHIREDDPPPIRLGVWV